jgi:hypothetical protein
VLSAPLRVLALSLLIAGAAPRAASAEWHLTPMIGVTFHGQTSFQDLEQGSTRKHANFGGSVALLGGGTFGIEGIGVVTPGFFQTEAIDLVASSRSMAVMGNVALTLPRRWTEYGLRPVLSGGFGVLRAAVADNSGFRVHSNLAAFNVGGGAIGFFSKRVGVRFDARYYSSLHRTDQGAVSFGPVHLSYATASIGLVLRR